MERRIINLQKNTDSEPNFTLKQFLQNPTGKNTSYMSSREKIKENLTVNYLKLLKQNKGKFETKIFRLEKDRYLFWFQIPSEKFPDFFYDVCLEFTLSEVRSLYDANIKFFSNSPNFMFTYTYVLNQMNLLVDFLKTKCSSIALKDAPNIKNPIESFGFEKSCYFAALYIKDMSLYKLDTVEKNALKFDKNLLLSKIKSSEEKLKEYNKRKKAVQKEKKTTTKKATVAKESKPKKTSNKPK